MVAGIPCQGDLEGSQPRSRLHSLYKTARRAMGFLHSPARAGERREADDVGLAETCEGINMELGLDAMAPGQRGRIATLVGSGPMARRLGDLGFVQGTGITCLYRSPAGDPTA